jgi:hypothetical protein
VTTEEAPLVSAAGEKIDAMADAAPSPEPVRSDKTDSSLSTEPAMPLSDEPILREKVNASDVHDRVWRSLLEIEAAGRRSVPQPTRMWFTAATSSSDVAAQALQDKNYWVRLKENLVGARVSAVQRVASELGVSKESVEDSFNGEQSRRGGPFERACSGLESSARRLDEGIAKIRSLPGGPAADFYLACSMEAMGTSLEAVGLLK